MLPLLALPPVAALVTVPPPAVPPLAVPPVVPPLVVTPPAVTALVVAPPPLLAAVVLPPLVTPLLPVGALASLSASCPTPCKGDALVASAVAYDCEFPVKVCTIRA
uniref:Uncharacterized protein n=1 Tax=Mycobacterium riyadhense TaxID=486698 RepID=A0A653EDU5_9MYCO|nr:hypothetical protein BIN_B_01188 [Mycobacterium riyadhense]